MAVLLKQGVRSEHRHHTCKHGFKVKPSIANAVHKANTGPRRRPCEGFAYIAVVIDLYSRRVIGWALQCRQTTHVVLQALLMAVWRHKPKEKVSILSDQGSQLTSMGWASFLKHHNLVHSTLSDTLYRLPSKG